jgi:NAD(P)-dependent dehydrogenase (short-subunit alcohol dehydrogenase family)
MNHHRLDATGKVILVTGATDGLGKAVSFALAERGGTVLLHGRDERRLTDTAAEIAVRAPEAIVRTYRADFASLKDVRDMAATIVDREPRLDILISNAGIGFPSERRESLDGNELVLQVNHLAGYLLVCDLIDLLATSAPARIVFVASAGQQAIDFSDFMLREHYDPGVAYQRSKLAQAMTAFDLALRLPAGVTVNAVHPSTYMPTKLLTGDMQPRTSLDQGVNAVVRLALDPKLATMTGEYINVKVPARGHPQAYDPEARQRLRELTDQAVATALIGY